MRPGGRRVGTVAALALGCLAVSGTAAQAQTTGDGVTVPAVWLTAGTGNQTLDITVSGSPVIGSAAQISVVTDSPGPVLAVSGAGAGGDCVPQNSGVWFCSPSGSVWRAGAITVTVSTAKADVCTGSGVTLTCDRTPLTVGIAGLGTPVELNGGISISPAQPTAPPTTSAPESRPSPAQSVAAVHTTSTSASVQPSASAAASKVASKSAVAVPVGATASASGSPAGAAEGGTSATASAAAVLDASDTSSSSSSSDGLLFGVLIAVVVLLAAGLGGWRWKVSRSGVGRSEPTQEIESPDE